jgi:hypothetical protein
MTVSELSHDEQLALVALMEAVAITDDIVSDTEDAEIGKVASALGDETYRGLVAESEKRFADIEQLKAFLIAIRRQESRELILEEVMEEAGGAAAFNHADAELLNWLAKTWDIPVENVPECGDGE